MPFPDPRQAGREAAFRDKQVDAISWDRDPHLPSCLDIGNRRCEDQNCLVEVTGGYAFPTQHGLQQGVDGQSPSFLFWDRMSAGFLTCKHFTSDSAFCSPEIAESQGPS